MANFSDIKVLLFGTGAVGSLYAGKLAQAGASVSAVCRSDYDTVRRNGIKVKSIWGDFHFKPENVLRNGSEFRSDPDYIIVATKVLPEAGVPAMIKGAVKPLTSIVLLQNGIDIEKETVTAFPGNEIISALAFVCVSREEYGFVRHQDYGKIVLGSYPSGISERARLLAEMFNSVRIPAETVEDIIAVRWRKLLWNAPFNPLSVLGGGVDTGRLLSSPYMADLAENIMKEVAALSEADGHPVPEGLIRKNLEDTYRQTPYKTSMLLDFEGKRPMEVEAIVGNAVRIAEKYGINTPYLNSVYAILDMVNRTNLGSKGSDLH